MSPNKRADPLGWPFGALDPRELRRLLKQQPKPVYPPAPFLGDTHEHRTGTP
jgi:hypothetical protein